MFITTTYSKPAPRQLDQVEVYMAGFLPRLRQIPGVEAAYHYLRPELGDEVTVIIWKDQSSLVQYREGPYFKEAMAFDKENHLPSQREGFPLVYPA